VTVLYTSRAHLQSSCNRHFRSGTLRAKSCRKYKHIIWLLLSRYWMFSSPRVLQSAHVRNGCARACVRRWSRMNNDDDDAIYILYKSMRVCIWYVLHVHVYYMHRTSAGFLGFRRVDILVYYSFFCLLDDFFLSFSIFFGIASLRCMWKYITRVTN